MHDLFHAQDLEDLFRHLNELWLSEDEWSYLIGCIVNAVECVPDEGAATRDRPDDKVRIRDKQTRADALLSQLAVKARGLADLLDELDDLRATVPGETYSSLALIESALSRNAADDDFKRFNRELSSYKRNGFPAPAELLRCLAASADAHPPASKVFSDDPWLSSQKSSWRDFMRIMARCISDIYAMYQVRIVFKEKHWIALVHALISHDISRSSVNAERRNLPPFPWEKQKK
ncbi:hypothetical protein AC731_006040 [Thauera humireducens]|uniref:Uncharacterized protein n=2 Tax=Thauera humireducens TaxID=1134435 RepID=A0A127K3K5_9RHOO|nr:hypothetical protein AC731_006040 [Thauera humireducens]